MSKNDLMVRVSQARTEADIRLVENQALRRILGQVQDQVRRQVWDHQAKVRTQIEDQVLRQVLGANLG